MKKKYLIILVATISLLMFFFYFKQEKVYTLKEYNKKGKLLGTNEYVIRKGDTILQGKFINYNEKGNKIAEGILLMENQTEKAFITLIMEL